jgi:hypothetical protein
MWDDVDVDVQHAKGASQEDERDVNRIVYIDGI